MVRRGSTGDGSDNDFSDAGGGSETDAGSGVTGDDGAETSFGGGDPSGGISGDPDSGGVGAGTIGDSDIPDDPDNSDRPSGVVGGGGDRRGSGSDTTFDGGDTDTDAPSGVTGGDSSTTFEGGRSGQNRPEAPEGSTGADDPQNTKSPERGVSFTRGPGTDGIERTGGPPVREGETADRGTGITRGPEGAEVVTPADRDAPENDGVSTPASPEDAVSLGPAQQRDAGVNQFAARGREGGQTALDRALEGFEADTGLDLVPGEGDVVQGTERFLGDVSTDIREGETFLPTPDEAERFGADAAATAAVGGRGREFQVLDATLDREEATRGFGGEFARLSAETANIPAAILGTGRIAEAAGETGFNLAAGFAGRGLDEENIGPLDDESQDRLAEAALGAGARGRDQLGDATRTAVQGAEETAERIQNRPAEALGAGAFLAGSALAGTAAGTAATRGLSALPDRVRSVRARRAADARVDFEDVTSERGAEGDLPLFETDTDAPTGEAVDEVRQRAADNPDAVLDAVDEDRALFQSTEAELGPGFEARRGSSELPGLFTSPDASPLRLDVGNEQSSSMLSTNVRLPRLRDFTSRDDRLAAFPGDRVEGFPDDGTGSGRVPDGDGGFEPDPDTSGARFLDEEAEEGTAFVRPEGARTTELEALFPPGSEFGQSGSLAVDLPSGRTVPIDVFRRADDLPDADGGGPLGRFLGDERGRATLGDDRGDATRTVREIDDELRRLRRRDRDRLEGEPTAPLGSTGTTSSSASSTGLPTVGDLSSSFGSDTPAPSTAATFDSGVFDSPGGLGSGFSSPGGSDPSPPSLFSTPSSPTPSSPSSPGSPSGSSPSSPGSPSSPTGPTGGTPSTPGLPGTPSTTRRPRDNDRDDDDELFDSLFGTRTDPFENPVETPAEFLGVDEP
jgi:hypothetical protein